MKRKKTLAASPIYGSWNKSKVIQTTLDIDDYRDTFLSSVFAFYYGHLSIQQKATKKTVEVQVNDAFLSLTRNKCIFLIDFPNIVHTLFHHRHSHNVQLAAKALYEFVYTQLEEGARVILISKPVKLDGVVYTVVDIFNQGRELYGKKIDKSYFTSGQCIVYDLHLVDEAASSIDDLVCMFIGFVIFVYLLRSGVDPAKEDKDGRFQRMNILTNDGQFFDKNLFGKTVVEKKKNIQYLRDLNVSMMMVDEEGNFYLKYNKFDGLLMKLFLTNYDRADINDTGNLECNLTTLIELLLQQKDPSIEPHGYFSRHSNRGLTDWNDTGKKKKRENTRKRRIPDKINPNFEKHHFTRRKLPDFSYANLNKLERQNKDLKHNKTCNMRKMMKKGRLMNYYYLYTFIKYMQSYLHTKHQRNMEYADFYGNYSKSTLKNIYLNRS